MPWVDVNILQGTSNSSGSTVVKKAQDEGGVTNGQNGATNVGVEGVGEKIFYLGFSFFLNSPFFPPFSYVSLSY